MQHETRGLREHLGEPFGAAVEPQLYAAMRIGGFEGGQAMARSLVTP